MKFILCPAFLRCQSCPFLMEVYTESCEGRLRVDGLGASGKKLQNALIEATIGKVRSGEGGGGVAWMMGGGDIIILAFNDKLHYQLVWIG